MKATFHRWFILLVSIALFAFASMPSGVLAAQYDPAAADYSGNKGQTIYVSKKGDNSDGSSWQKAFHTIQAALLAVPDMKGGHTIVIRPDTYVEANLSSDHPGAKGSYNLLVGDFDGKLGSGATGWVILDSSCPGVAVRSVFIGEGYGDPPFEIIQSDLPESGLKCVDWWGPVRSTQKKSTDDWDRWIFRNLYSTGSEGGISWVMTNPEGAEISGIQENCVGIGRFSGTCVAGHIARKDEPVVFRHCYFACLDWWGDAGGVYVRAHEKSMPDYPDAVFEDCTIVSPDNALQVGYPAFEGYTRVKFKDCRLISLNFSQPRGMPGSGIVCCDVAGKYLHLDFEDCSLMGYKLFGRSTQKVNGVADRTAPGDPSYSLKGKVQVYVQFEQPTPEGFERLGLWPADVFLQIAPPRAPEELGVAAK